MQIPNTGLQFTPEQILKKYKPLRKVRVPLTFSLLYYPYFLTSVTGAIKGRIVKKRFVHAQMVVNGLSGRVYRLANLPDIEEENVSESEQPFLVQPPEITASYAAARTQEAALLNWKRKDDLRVLCGPWVHLLLCLHIHANSSGHPRRHFGRPQDGDGHL
ncbi:hypothetical protein AALA99_07260 [Anaerotruncus colihominis]|uniref:hypothetical protein n=1 Tax=Anaerotruncus colihominis TaxID=169435 RepID=UPI0035162BB8